MSPTLAAIVSVTSLALTLAAVFIGYGKLTNRVAVNARDIERLERDKATREALASVEKSVAALDKRIDAFQNHVDQRFDRLERLIQGEVTRP